MIEHLYPNFLRDERIYSQVEQFWINLWGQIDPAIRTGWQQPWFQPLPPSISEGNPIFSAVSPSLKRGIRILQAEPIEKALEFVAYPDTFGGSIFDSNAIRELVISCALSDAEARLALSLMALWVEGKAVSFDLHEAGLIASSGSKFDRIYSDCLIPESDLIVCNGFVDDRLSARIVVPAA